MISLSQEAEFYPGISEWQPNVHRLKLSVLYILILMQVSVISIDQKLYIRKYYKVLVAWYTMYCQLVWAGPRDETNTSNCEHSIILVVFVEKLWY